MNFSFPETLTDEWYKLNEWLDVIALLHISYNLIISNTNEYKVYILWLQMLNEWLDVIVKHQEFPLFQHDTNVNMAYDGYYGGTSQIYDLSPTQHQVFSADSNAWHH